MKIPRIALFGLIGSFLLIILGCFLALNSCATENEPPITEDQPLDSHPANHYEGLENVIINKNIPQQIKEYTGFTVSFNKDNHTPNYVAWELLGEEIQYDIDRSDNFWYDPDIIGCPSHRDYSYSGYDRGHICPAADQKWSVKAMEDSFVMANICPQDHQLNAGAWLTLETKERTWAQRDSAIIIIAGPIYSENDTKRIGDIGVRVPGAFFKAFLAPYVKEPRAIAFVYPNMASPGNMQNYAMSIDDLEEILGYDLFSSLPDHIEKVVEARYSFAEWNKSK